MTKYGKTGVFSIVILLAAYLSPILANEEIISLDGHWRFTIDAENKGLDAKWFAKGFDRTAWQLVGVPHTWQVMKDLESYYGPAWYARILKLDSQTTGKTVKLEFEAVYRDATVWINGKLLGEHKGSGYTPFAFFLDDIDKSGGEMEIVVRVDNKFSNKALPYLNSFDWPNDGGIIRSVQLRISPASHIARLLVDATLNNDRTKAKILVRSAIYCEGDKPDAVRATVLDPSGNAVANFSAKPQSVKERIYSAQLDGTIDNPELWHFDKPRLYTLICHLTKGDKVIHEKQATFGIRRVEVKDGLYFLNDEPMRLMGVEWMPASDPRYGMAESPDFVRKILADMKRLNCIISRFHWQQDDSTFDFCDREGMLVQEEIPAWGGQTRLNEVNDIQNMQMREMILAHYNHPSIYAWGLCNEIKGQSPQGHAFVRRGIEAARALDPYRLLTYASNTLYSNPGRDASSLVDFVELNEYYESWLGGGLTDLRRNLEFISAAFPDKTLVISEYGLCECSEKNPVGDDKRIQILQTHTDCCRQAKCVAGAIFFCYNDYRTFIGDKGTGAFKQRVHGIVDLFNKPKKSYDVLRRESSPIRTLAIEKSGDSNEIEIRIITRSLADDFPAYTLREYLLVCTAYNQDAQPIDARKISLPDLPPGTNRTEKIQLHVPAGQSAVRIFAEVFRPTGYSVLDAQWKNSAGVNQ